MAEENVLEGGPGTEAGSVDRGQGARHEAVLKGSDMVFAEGEESKALYKELLKKKKALKPKFSLSSEQRRTSLAEYRENLGSHTTLI